MEPSVPRPAGVLESAWYAFPAIAVLVLAYGDVFGIRFLNDDFVFLDRARGHSVLDAFANREPLFGWYRPWSRELHYLAVLKLFGPSVTAFHAVSVLLFAGVAIACGRLMSLVAGASGARFAAAGFLAMSAWAAPVLWIAGVQDLWMLLAALLYLEAELRQRPRWLGALLLAVALLSKETAAVLPFLAAAMLATLRGIPWPRAAVRVAPGFALLAAWALVHPRLGSRLLGSAAGALPAAGSGFDPRAITRTITSVINLERWPNLAGVSFELWIGGALLAVAMAVLLLFAGWRRPDRETPMPGVGRRRIAAAVWMLIGWLPAMAAGSSWHAYYGLLGAAGAWALLATLIGSRPVRVALVAAVALSGVISAGIPSDDWGTPFYLRRGASFVAGAEHELRRQVPDPPRGSRFYFVNLPFHVGFITADAPAIRVLYRDPTLSGGYWSQYRSRPPGLPGRDYFFRHDSIATLVEVRRGPEALDSAIAANPRWARDHEALAASLSKAGDWHAAAEECLKLVAAYPGNPEYLFNAGLARLGLRDTTGAGDLIRRAALAPGARPEIRRAAAEFAELTGGGAR